METGENQNQTAAPANDGGIMSPDQSVQFFESDESDSVFSSTPSSAAVGKDGAPIPDDKNKSAKDGQAAGGAGASSVAATGGDGASGKPGSGDDHMADLEKRGKAIMEGRDPDADPGAGGKGAGAAGGEGAAAGADGKPGDGSGKGGAGDPKPGEGDGKPVATAAGIDVEKALTDAIAELATKDPAFKQFADDFPEAAKHSQALARAVLGIVGKIPDVGKVMEERIAAIQAKADEAVSRANAQFVQRTFQMELTSLRPDWRQKIATPEYQAWYAKQSDAVKRLGCVPDVKSATMLLDAYDKATGKGGAPGGGKTKGGSFAAIAAAAPGAGPRNPAVGGQDDENLTEAERQQIFNDAPE